MANGVAHGFLRNVQEFFLDRGRQTFFGYPGSSEIVEFTVHGRFIGQLPVDPNLDGAFGLNIVAVTDDVVRFCRGRRQCQHTYHLERLISRR
jgi:hypothetical protein